MWGPYRIDPDLYCRALKQIALLDSGDVKYKAGDALHFSDRVCNCNSGTDRAQKTLSPLEILDHLLESFDDVLLKALGILTDVATLQSQSDALHVLAQLLEPFGKRERRSLPLQHV